MSNVFDNLFFLFFFSVDLDWGTEIESVNNIMETLEAFHTEFFDPSIFCTNPVPNSKYRLASVVRTRKSVECFLPHLLTSCLHKDM